MTAPVPEPYLRCPATTRVIGLTRSNQLPRVVASEFENAMPFADFSVKRSCDCAVSTTLTTKTDAERTSSFVMCLRFM